MAQQLAECYSTLPEDLSGDDSDDSRDDEMPLQTAGNSACSSRLVSSAAAAHVQHVLYPALRWGLLPPKEMATDGTVAQLACLEKLYRVFERC